MQSVLEILFLNSKQNTYEGTFCLETLSKKQMKTIRRLKASDMCDFIKNELEIKKGQDYYITANGFKNYTKRESNNLFSLNNIVLDFDIHERINNYERQEKINTFIWRLKRDLFNIPPPFNVPAPNVIHYTGRGVQLWYHLESTAASLLWLYREVCEQLLNVIRDFLEEYPDLKKYIEIDAGTSKNGAGLFRLFNTYNTHTHTLTKYEILHDKAINLNELKQLLPPLPKKEKKEPKKQTSTKPKERKSPRFSGWASTHLNRLLFIEEMAKQDEDQNGRRENMIFLAYNAAVQCLSKAEAKRRIKELNSSFSVSLKEREIKAVFDEIDYKKVYKFSNERFYEFLEIEENEKVKLTEQSKDRRKPNSGRDAERTKNKERKKELKKQAVKLLTAGKTHKEVSEELGLSVRTIDTISAELKKEIRKPWDELGISRATYYRRLKKEK